MERARSRPSAVERTPTQRDRGKRPLIDGRFEIRTVLARSAMGVVYDGRDRLLDRPVVVKIVAPQLAEIVTSSRRLVQEAWLAGRLSHPGLVAIHHIGVLREGEPYVVMERLVGHDLQTHCALDGWLTPASALSLLEPVADALEHLHRAGIVHRDIQPSNLFVLAPSASPRVKIVGLGLAQLDDAHCARLAARGLVARRTEYLAPECARGPSTAASDTYALATVAFELLSGSLPYVGSGQELLAIKAREPARRLDDVVAEPWAQRLAPILARALGPPDRRPTPIALVRAIRAEVDQLAAPEAPSLPRPLRERSADEPSRAAWTPPALAPRSELEAIPPAGGRVATAALLTAVFVLMATLVVVGVLATTS